EVGAVDDEAPVLAAPDEPRARQVREMERERRRRQVELLADGARRHPLGACFDEEAINAKARFLGEGRERVDGLLRFHSSRIMEMKWPCQALSSGTEPELVRALTPN